jgi:alpha,alpha-trehalose-phosphate synthase [UDP-forming]
LGDGELFVVSNREPYIHTKRGNEVECIVPPSGLVTAIEPILRTCNGTWVAYGSGSEDPAFVDDHDHLRVPPDDPRYTLRRVWLSGEEESHYYDGFANEGLWPLCHIAHTRPVFRAADWSYYQEVNEKFGNVLDEEMRLTENPVVFVQDYHFALLPRIIKNRRPHARVAIFWHIPWPNPEAFSICPWQAQLLDGLLGADLIGFHVQSHCNNFLDTVDRVLEARSDREHFSVSRNGHLTLVRPYPISVAWDEGINGAERGAETGAGEARVDGDSRALRRELGVEGTQLILGVDRLDYTKGIVERFLALESLFEEHAYLLEKVVLVQIAAPSRTHIPSYAQLRKQVEECAARINRRFSTEHWKPINLIEKNISHEELNRYYRAAEVCLVTSLHDGMNLVAKEYLVSRSDNDGVLILSSFAGAAHELPDALIINPYDIQQVGEAIRTALEMNPEERRQRMIRMRTQIKEHNVYRWAATVLTDLCNVRLENDSASGVPDSSGAARTDLVYR